MNKEIFDYVESLCKGASKASKEISVSSAGKRNAILEKIAINIKNNQNEILEANKLDVEHAEENGVIKTMIDRLSLNEKRLDGICDSIRELVYLDDVLGKGDVWTRPNGLEIKRVKVPLGVVAMIYEARPNVTVDAACLCIKTGNAVILRGGKEAINTNRVFVRLMREAIKENGIDENSVCLIDDITREGTEALFTMCDYVDVLIPRGSKGLIKKVVESAKMPVIETGAGNCHLYVDESADMNMAVNVAVNAKNSRPAVCNAIETVLVHEKVADEFLTRFAKESEKYSLEIRGCEKTCAILKNIKQATESDYEEEYDDFIIAAKVVSNVKEAVEHINKYNTKHSEAIITKNVENADYFEKNVDAACVYVNASTRFTDGNEFGFGAEIGISTQKMHARGPMGLEALTTVKYYIKGNGQIR